MSSELLINVTPRETRIALVENGVLQELYLERGGRRGLVGNIYKGRVSRVLPGMQAAFIDIGLERAAFLHVSDIVSATRPVRASIGEDAPNNEARLKCDERASEGDASARNAEAERLQHEDITLLLTEGQEIQVQVIKDPLGTKGARLTTHISLPSRYVVLMPHINTIGVSQRIEDEQERQRLRELVRSVLQGNGGAEETAADEDPESRVRRFGSGGYILRTAAEGVPEDQILADMAFLEKLWTSLQRRAETSPACCIVYEELPLVMRTLREMVGNEVERVRVDSGETLERAVDFARQFVPEMVDRIEQYTGERPIFDIYGVEDELQRALERQVSLKSGGHLVIDQTEAMTTIDVNTGAFVGHRNLEETIFKTNLEAAQAIARQLRLRNLGGIIIIDFIDMCSEEHKRQVLRALEKSLERDHTRTHISEVSSLGLVEMTRKRTRESLGHLLCEPCPTCDGRGSVKTAETVCFEIFREIMREARQYEAEKLLVLASREVVDRLLEEESDSVAELETFINKPIEVQVESMYAQEQYDVVLM
ncbi:MAG: Rne/Rng family ribonuclease [Gammaproteobacteria bacterium]|nr:Rne/Rng family ribonuclease [Gammaproteobacteria bacterium]